MNITIYQIAPRRENGEFTSVSVHFTARTSDGDINLSGSIPINDFAGSIDFGALENDVRQKVVDRILNGDLPNAE